jgi:triosephosphate isomerase
MKYIKFNLLTQDHLVLKTNNKIIFANWKMNFLLKDVIDFCKEISKQPSQIRGKLALAAPSVYLSLINYTFPDICLASQDVSIIEKNEGSFTGEISAHMLSSINVKYSIIGHCERRRFFGENNEQIILKATNCLKNGITPIVCFGEEKIGDDPIESVIELKNHFQNTDKVIYAYEPYWAIGNQNFQFDIIAPNLNRIISYLKTTNQNNTKSVIYGGSVNNQNIDALNTIENLDGLLVGSASLDLNQLLKILESI